MKKDELTTETTANAKPKLAEVALHDVEIMEIFTLALLTIMCGRLLIMVGLKNNDKETINIK